MTDITIRFPDGKWADAFWGWYLDGGGCDGFQSTIDDRGLDALNKVEMDWSGETRTITYETKECMAGCDATAEVA